MCEEKAVTKKKKEVNNEQQNRIKKKKKKNKNKHTHNQGDTQPLDMSRRRPVQAQTKKKDNPYLN